MDFNFREFLNNLENFNLQNFVLHYIMILQHMKCVS